MFAIEIEYLSGVSFASKITSPSEPEWPPHPDRVFLALVAAWGSKENPEGADALRWLESQDPPDIVTPNVHHRDRFVNFVPTSSNAENTSNVFKEKGTLEIRSSISRKGRHFPATVLPDDDPTVRMIWRESDPPQDVRDTLSELASRVPHIGHSASLTRVAVADSEILKTPATYVYDNKGGNSFLRCPYKGRFDELTRKFAYSANKKHAEPWRPSTAPERRYSSLTKSVIQSPMGDGDEWIVLSCTGSFVPVLEAFPKVAKKMREAIMSHSEDPIHEVISGHNPDGTVLQKPHLAIVPMANVGWMHSDGSLLGIAVILPRASGHGTDERRQIRQAVSRFLHSGGELDMKPFGIMTLERQDDQRLSLSPGRYTGEGKEWTTVTPIVLDHYPKKKRGAEDIVADSCVRIGLPRPIQVRVSRHSSVLAAPAAYIANGSKKGWQSPKEGSLNGRFLCHADIVFEESVRGPIIIGAGRYYGLGLCVIHHRQKQL